MSVPVDLQELERQAVVLNRKIRSLGRPLTPEELLEVNVTTARIRAGIAQRMVDRLIVNRPEVVSSGQPVAGTEAKRGQDEARARLHAKPEFKQACSNCPAAQVSRRVDGAVIVRCQVEGSTLSSAEDPQSVLTFCLGDHQACPSWMAEKEAIAAGRRTALA